MRPRSAMARTVPSVFAARAAVGRPSHVWFRHPGQLDQDASDLGEITAENLLTAADSISEISVAAADISHRGERRAGNRDRAVQQRGQLDVDGFSCAGG